MAHKYRMDIDPRGLKKCLEYLWNNWYTTTGPYLDHAKIMWTWHPWKIWHCDWGKIFEAVSKPEFAGPFCFLRVVPPITHRQTSHHTLSTSGRNASLHITATFASSEGTSSHVYRPIPPVFRHPRWWHQYWHQKPQEIEPSQGHPWQLLHAKQSCLFL